MEKDPVLRSTVAIIRLDSHIAAIMRQWRHEPALGHAQEIAPGLNLLPRAYLSGIFKRVEVVASDVPGMPNAVWLAGRRFSATTLRANDRLGPQRHADVLAGRCNIGVNIDTGAVEDPPAMLDCLREGFEQILAVGRTGTPARST